MTTGVGTRRAAGPSGQLLTGSLAAFRRDPIGLLQQAAREYGDLVRLRLGPVLAHLINHPDYVQHVLVDYCRRYDKQTRSVAKIRATCGESLLTTDGPAWRRQRRIVQPAFQAGYLEAYLPAMQETIARRMAVWQDAARQGQPLEMVSEMLHLTLQVAARTLFGADVRGDADVIERSLRVILDDTWRRLESVIDVAAVSPAFHRKRFREALRDIDDVVRRIVASRRHQCRRDDLLSVLLQTRDEQSGECLSDQELRDAVVTLLLAGHETTANALTWTFSLLARHPDSMARLRQELSQVLGQDDPDINTLQQLEYVNQVFAESIRLYPSIWIMERRVVIDDSLDGIRIPAGSTLLISPFTLHRNPVFWESPESFDPDRFTAARMNDRPRLAYIPFGVGPHACIGQAMARQVARLTIAMVCRRFRFALAEGQRCAARAGITLQPATSLWMYPELLNSHGGQDKWNSQR